MSLPDRMTAVQLTGQGGYDKLVYRDDLPLPQAGPGEVLIRVHAAGVNNTDINMRTAWYVQADTETGAAPSIEFDEGVTLGGSIRLPMIQGADCCGRIAAVGAGVDPGRIGERVIVDPMSRDTMRYLGAERPGAFAQYTTALAENAWAVETDMSDVELASFPCSYSTAENLLTRSGVAPGQRVLVTGASGGVGSAAVQLARARGATVIAVSTAAKAGRLRQIGADEVIDRDRPASDQLGRNSVDVVIDLVGGESWPDLLHVLRHGGHYATSGAIAGPMVSLDLRTLYFKDLTLHGCTDFPPETFGRLVRWLESGKVAPLVAHVFPLAEIARAQKTFLAKSHVGKIVLSIP